MDEPQLDQRIEKIELALTGIFESPKVSAISSYDEGTRLFAGDFAENNARGKRNVFPVDSRSVAVEVTC